MAARRKSTRRVVRMARNAVEMELNRHAPAQPRRRVALAHQTIKADAGNETHVFVGQVLLPREYEERVHSNDVINMPNGEATMIYLSVGWNLGGDTETHMIELTSGTPGGRGGHVTPTQIREALANTRRCYCERCLDRDSHSMKDRKVAQLIEVLSVRKTIADANSIPTDGHPDNEAKINRLLEAATDA